MNTLLSILTVLNSIGLITALIIYLKNNYTIVSISQWNEIANVYNACVENGILDEKTNSLILDGITELPGGCGFFKEQLEEEYLEEE